MHTYLTARGMPDYINRWENDCLARYIPYEYEKGKTGRLQFSLRPVRVYDLVYPEAMYDDAMSMVKPNNDDNRLNIGMGFLRKFMKAQKAKPYNHDPSKWIPRGNVTVNCIGTKKDEWKDGIEQI